MIRRALPVLALLAAACESPRIIGSPDVVTRPPIAANSPDEAFGRQVQIDTRLKARFYGELVACDETHAYLYANAVSGQPWLMVPWDDITEASVLLGGPATAVFTTWTVLGTLSAGSHGFFAIVSAPIWLGVGIPTIFWARSEQDVTGKCAEIKPYARYPQGMPPVVRERYWGPMPIPSGAVPIPGMPTPAPSGPPVAPIAPAPSMPAPPSGPQPAPITPPASVPAPPTRP